MGVEGGGGEERGQQRVRIIFPFKPGKIRDPHSGKKKEGRGGGPPITHLSVEEEGSSKEGWRHRPLRHEGGEEKGKGT